MDQETVSKINRSLLEKAKRSMKSKKEGDDTMYSITLAIVSAVVVYFLLDRYQPRFVMVKDDKGVEAPSAMRITLAAIISGALLYYILQR